jgi:hypothetical protein
MFSPQMSPFLVRSGSKSDPRGEHAEEDGEGVVDTPSSQPERFRTITASLSGRAVVNRVEACRLDMMF